VLLLIGVVVYIFVSFGRSRDDYLTNSFEKLFEVYGK
jgi:hypothetical protein